MSASGRQLSSRVSRPTGQEPLRRVHLRVMHRVQAQHALRCAEVMRGSCGAGSHSARGARPMNSGFLLSSVIALACLSCLVKRSGLALRTGLECEAQARARVSYRPRRSAFRRRVPHGRAIFRRPLNGRTARLLSARSIRTFRGAERGERCHLIQSGAVAATGAAQRASTVTGSPRSR